MSTSINRELSNNNDKDNCNVKKQLVLWAKQELCTCIALFRTFLWGPLHHYNVKPSKCGILWTSWMYEDNCFPLFLNLDKFLKNWTPGKITYMYIWQIERVQIDAIKFERNKFIFLMTFLMSSLSLLLLSLKAP